MVAVKPARGQARPLSPGDTFHRPEKERAMKYRHSFHAGNFADIHKHVTLLALLTSLKRKEKGFAYFETHAGRGAYDLSHLTAEATGGAGRFSGGEDRPPELRGFAALLGRRRAG